MCLSTPGQIIGVTGGTGLERRATLDLGGIEREVSLALVPEATVGDYVLVHSGFAIRLCEPPATSHQRPLTTDH